VKEDEVTDAPDEVKALAEQRLTSKKAKDFITADDLRRQIEALGWTVKDSKDGYTLIPK
jgi:cysteinyl-tRNA synthetase